MSGKQGRMKRIGKGEKVMNPSLFAECWQIKKNKHGEKYTWNQ